MNSQSLELGGDTGLPASPARAADAAGARHADRDVTLGDLPVGALHRFVDLTNSTLFIALSFVGYPIGSLLSIPLLNGIERRTLVIGSILSIAVFGLGFAYSGNTALIVCFGVLTTCASNVFSNAYHVYRRKFSLLACGRLRSAAPMRCRASSAARCRSSCGWCSSGTAPVRCSG